MFMSAWCLADKRLFNLRPKFSTQVISFNLRCHAINTGTLAAILFFKQEMTKNEKYRCWFLINQHIEKRDFDSIEQKAVQAFLKFIEPNDYGNSIGLFRFDIYVESKINFGRHADKIYTGCAHLSTHVDKQYFENSDDDKKVKLLLNAAFVLLNYLAARVVLPKGFLADKLSVDFKQFLNDSQLLLPEHELKEVIVKPFDTTKFEFVITQTWEVKKDTIHYDLNDIQDFVNNHLSGQTFGQSVRKFDFGYEIFDFKGDFAQFRSQTAGLKRYGTKYKNVLVVKQFDYRIIKDMNEGQQLSLLKKEILEAIEDTNKLTRKPKDFDVRKFYNTIDTVLTKYTEKKNSR
jgi:hypothetical protein